MTLGRTLGLYGNTGVGKTTQIGEAAKWVYKKYGLKTKLNAADMGGHESINALVKLGIIVPEYLTEKDDPWEWVDRVSGEHPGKEYGLVANDSATSICEAVMSAAAKSPQQIGSQKSQKFSVKSGSNLVVGANTESHYNVVQSFMLDRIWKSTWLAAQGLDVIWTFGEHRAESQTDAPIIGPKLAGKALTPSVPKWLKYTLRMVAVPVQGESTRHLLQIQEQPEFGGLGVSFANARYPKSATTPCPVFIEPASLVQFWDLIDTAQAEAMEVEKSELGL